MESSLGQDETREVGVPVAPWAAGQGPLPSVARAWCPEGPGGVQPGPAGPASPAPWPGSRRSPQPGNRGRTGPPRAGKGPRDFPVASGARGTGGAPQLAESPFGTVSGPHPGPRFDHPPGPRPGPPGPRWDGRIHPAPRPDVAPGAGPPAPLKHPARGAAAARRGPGAGGPHGPPRDRRGSPWLGARPEFPPGEGGPDWNRPWGRGNEETRRAGRGPGPPRERTRPAPPPRATAPLGPRGNRVGRDTPGRPTPPRPGPVEGGAGGPDPLVGPGKLENVGRSPRRRGPPRRPLNPGPPSKRLSEPPPGGPRFGPPGWTWENRGQRLFGPRGPRLARGYPGPRRSAPSRPDDRGMNRECPPGAGPSPGGPACFLPRRAPPPPR